jgi:hypothetical protein
MTHIPRSFWFGVASTTILGLVFANRHPATADVTGQTDASTFTVHEIRFDESGGGPPGPTPTVPKSWQFVGVSNGEKMNSNNLWFRDTSGRIIMLQGFTDAGKFIIDTKASVLETENR